jgi:hypothetical protein
MNPIYEVIETALSGTCIRATYEDGLVKIIPTDLANKDYAEYLESLNDNSETE